MADNDDLMASAREKRSAWYADMATPLDPMTHGMAVCYIREAYRCGWAAGARAALLASPLLAEAEYLIGYLIGHMNCCEMLPERTAAQNRADAWLARLARLREGGG